MCCFITSPNSLLWMLNNTKRNVWIIHLGDTWRWLIWSFQPILLDQGGRLVPPRAISPRLSSSLPTRWPLVASNVKDSSLSMWCLCGLQPWRFLAPDWIKPQADWSDPRACLSRNLHLRPPEVPSDLKDPTILSSSSIYKKEEELKGL